MCEGIRAQTDFFKAAPFNATDWGNKFKEGGGRNDELKWWKKKTQRRKTERGKADTSWHDCWHYEPAAGDQNDMVYNFRIRRSVSFIRILTTHSQPACICVYSTGACVTGVRVSMRLWGPSISSGLQVTSGLLNLSSVIPFECVHSLWSDVSFKISQPFYV